jgi:Icc-related predicted phosphoesterase
MLKLQLMSDIHVEFHADGGASFLDALDPMGVDVLVLAGDICPTKILRGNWFIHELCDKYPHVVMVAGNHSCYGSYPSKSMEALKEVENQKKNFTFLQDCEPVTVAGQRFLGDTFWFPYSPDNKLYECMMNDFRVIKQLRSYVYNQHRKCLRNLNAHLLPSDIVVTHHLPSLACIHPEYRGSNINRFFASDNDKLILDKQPKLWAHGHTHSNNDFKIGETRILCNAFGYPSEGGCEYIDKLVVEV